GVGAIRPGWRRRRRAGSLSVLQPPRLAVDVHTAGPSEAAEGEPAVLRELDGQRRRRAHRDDDRTPRDRRLLHELEREAAADAEDLVRNREELVLVCPA